MANGLGLWCVDCRTGEIVDLGGEYTWGDCNEVERVVRRLIELGHLPADGDYGDGLMARVVWIADGMPWVREPHLQPSAQRAVRGQTRARSQTQSTQRSSYAPQGRVQGE